MQNRNNKRNILDDYVNMLEEKKRKPKSRFGESTGIPRITVPENT